MEHLIDQLKRLDLLIQREVLRSRQNQGESHPWDRFAAVTDGEVDALFQQKPGEEGSSEEIPLLERLALLERTIGERVASSMRARVSLPLWELSRIFGLSRLEGEILVACLAPEIDRRYERFYGYLHDDMTRRRPSIGLALSLCCNTPAEQISARSLFFPSSPLVRYRLLEMVEESPTGSPFLSRPIKIDDRIVSFLLAENRPDPRIQQMLRWISPHVDRDPSRLPPRQDLEKRMILLVEGCFDENGLRKKPVFYLHGRPRAGKEALAQFVCGYFHLPLLVVDAEEMAAARIGFEDAIFLAVREGLLQPAAIYIDHFDLALGSEAPLRLKALSKSIHEMGGVTFLSGERTWSWELPDHPLFLQIELHLPDYAAQIGMWRSLLKEYPDLDEKGLSALASKYRLSSEEMEEAKRRGEAVATLRGKGAITLADLDQACRERSRPSLGPLARKVEAKYRWNDIVLPADPMKQLREICDQVQYRSTIYGRWGFDRKLSLGKGLSALFSGPPGTGKTMAAEIIANELALDLYKIDLSQVVSKYIGETEKNLHSIFRGSEESQAILFFDEADALFGKRSEVKDAHDRYANIEIGYLLQKMEEHEGVVILATNLRNNLDEAFLRRIHFAVEFPFPDEGYRLQIWKGMLPQEVPLSKEIDLIFLARQFKLSGGHIKNVVLASAFMAAAEGGALRMEHLIRATKREYQKLGWLCSKSDFGPYYDWVKE